MPWVSVPFRDGERSLFPGGHSPVPSFSRTGGVIERLSNENEGSSRWFAAELKRVQRSRMCEEEEPEDEPSFNEGEEWCVEEKPEGRHGVQISGAQ